jgi:hypothetical protein
MNSKPPPNMRTPATRALSTAPLIVAVLFAALFTAYYAKTVHWMVECGFQTGSTSLAGTCWDLRSEIVAIVWKPFPQSIPWAHPGWRLFHYGDAPEGTHAIVYFPSWRLLLPVVAVGIYGIVLVRRQHESSVP